MITVNEKEQIRRAYYIEGKSIRQIQRETGYHRETIRKALADGQVPRYTRQEPRPCPVLDPVKPIIQQWLDEDDARPPKQRHTAKRIHERLTTEHHFTGAASTVQPYLLPLPPRLYPCCVVRPVQANGFGLVTFQTNRYSVPADHVHEPLWLHAFVDRIEISNGQQVLAIHPRCYGREQDSLDP